MASHPNEPYGGVFVESPTEMNEIVKQAASENATHAEIERLSQSLTSFTGTGNVSFHRYVCDYPESIEQEKIVTLGWKNLVVRAGKKDLLHGVSGEISGGMVAIMGPSGSGKSTLLNALLQRLTTGVDIVEGEMSLNGHKVDRATLKRAVGYVMQDDVASPLLTVRETLRLVCALRFGHRETKQELTGRVVDVIEMMNLGPCADNVIGDGLSGGEKKRLSIALELLAFPRILVLDEPTSALDSLDALELVRSLRMLVDHHGITVICTIHQPQYKVFTTFERLILLSQGYIIYDGPVAGVPNYCARKRNPVRAGQNPADAVMDVASELEIDMDRLRRIPSLHLEHYMERGELILRDIAPRWLQFQVLVKRGFIMAQRRRNEFIVSTVLTVINAVLIGTVFLKSSHSASAAQTRMAAIFYCCTNQGTFGGISSLSAFSSERVLSLRERNSGIYHALPYYASKVLCETVLRFPFPLLFTCIVYFLIGFQPHASNFFFFWFIMWLDNLAACSLAMMISVWARLPEISSLVLPLGMEISRLFGAFFLAPIDARPGVHWIMRLSYLAWAYGAVAHNELDHFEYTCAPPGPCNPANGHAKLASLGLTELTKGQYVGGLIAFIVVCQVLTYFGVRFAKW